MNEVLRAVVEAHPARLTWLPTYDWFCGPEPYGRHDGVHLRIPEARRLWAGPLGDAVSELVGAPS